MIGFTLHTCESDGSMFISLPRDSPQALTHRLGPAVTMHTSKGRASSSPSPYKKSFLISYLAKSRPHRVKKSASVEVRIHDTPNHGLIGRGNWVCPLPIIFWTFKRYGLVLVSR